MTAKFITLTYDDPSLPLGDSDRPTLVKSDYQRFAKRLRKENGTHCNWPIRYYAVGEYGTETERPHYHAIMFNAHLKVINKLDGIWKYGTVHVGEVEPASIHYVTKYVINRVGLYKDRLPPFALMSRRPGIGAEYVNTHTAWHRADARYFTNVNGQKGTLPRYYKDKMFSDYERHLMAHEARKAADQEYREELERLEKFHSDPFAYYLERIDYSHAQIHSKINSLNKI